MSTDAVDTPLAHAASPDRLTDEPATFVALRSQFATYVRAQTEAIAFRWERQARGVGLHAVGAELSGDQIGATVQLLGTIAESLSSEGNAPESMLGVGYERGELSFERGASLHHTLKELDLLIAMVLYSAQVMLEESSEGYSASDAIRLSRRLQQIASLLTLAVAKGYTQAMGDGMRDRFRSLRHDLRNPLGTIKSVLSMMDDETLPEEARSHPRFRVMAERNARSLDEMIAARLSDIAALLPGLGVQEVSLRSVAWNVRRDLRADAEARHATVAVATTAPQVALDAASVELLLLAALQAAIQEAHPGDEIGIDFGEQKANRITVLLDCEPKRQLIADAAAVDQLQSLAAHLGAKVEIGEQLVISLPLRSPQPSPVSAGLIKASDDVAGRGEGHHGQPGAL